MEKKEVDFGTFLRPWDKPRIIEGLADDHYHAEVALSAGQLKYLNEKSVAHFKHAMERGKKPPTPAMKFGAMFHKAVLEGPEFLRLYKVMPEFTGLTKDGKMSAQSGVAKEKRAAWLLDQAPGTIIVEDMEEMDQITGMMESVLAHPTVKVLMKDSQKELSGFFNLDGFRCKMRADIWTTLNRIVDLKTAMDSSSDGFSRSAWDNFYPIQAALYIKGANALGHRVDSFDYIVVEKEPPYVTEVYSAEVEFISSGDFFIERGMKRLKQAIETDYWLPGPQQSKSLTIPPWAERRLQEMES